MASVETLIIGINNFFFFRHDLMMSFSTLFHCRISHQNIKFYNLQKCKEKEEKSGRKEEKCERMCVCVTNSNYNFMNKCRVASGLNMIIVMILVANLHLVWWCRNSKVECANLIKFQPWLKRKFLDYNKNEKEMLFPVCVRMAWMEEEGKNEFAFHKKSTKPLEKETKSAKSSFAASGC